MESHSKEIKDTKRSQAETLEPKIIITKIKSSVNGFHSMMEVTEGKISELEDKIINHST